MRSCGDDVGKRKLTWVNDTGKILLVENCNSLGRLQRRVHGGLVLGCERLGAIDDKEGKLAGLRGLERAFNAEVLDDIARIADAGGVK